jgi:hypothetical protein
VGCVGDDEKAIVGHEVVMGRDRSRFETSHLVF